MTVPSKTASRITIPLALLVVLILQLAHTSRANSVTWDEAHHLFDGYNIWTHHDYGLNPEVPPFAKLVAAAPLLPMHLFVPTVQDRSEQTEAFLDGKDFLFRNDANKLLFIARMTMAIFTVVLAVTIFAAGTEMLGPIAGLVALAFFVFDPNILAHGALVTTDVPIACCIFLALYLYYRYTRRPTLTRLLLVGLVTGLAMATKFTGLLVLPMLFLVAIAESVYGRDWRILIRRALAIIAVAFISYIVLWAFYGFRYNARPAGRELNPPLADYLKQVPDPHDSAHMALLARHHILPEAYIFGLANTKITEFADTSYFFGRIYRHGTRLYFPAALLIKSTLPFLILFAVGLALLIAGRLKRGLKPFILLAPPAFYFVVAMHSTMDIGYRHLLIIFPFLYIFIAAAAVVLMQMNRRWTFAIAALLLWQGVTSARVSPAYMAYANEAWGGPSHLHNYLGDANTDWGQQLKAAHQYLASHNIKDCWLAYFADGVVDTAYYGIPCKRLPTVETTAWLNLPMNVPPEIDGPILISDGVLAGIDYGDGALNPYEQFRELKPTAAIDYGLFVYDGHFKIPLASALVHATKAQHLLWGGNPGDALVEAQQAVALAPDSASVQTVLGDVLSKLNRPDEARQHYEQALNLTQTIKPELQTSLAAEVKGKLATLPTAEARTP
ncbi:glycosyl transferase [Edaphobacter acidisoli]|uniref:Glycosyl transferase n=1 Tax=Edaphobacter acidisoli TaxID=2040573 RepID=A0A916RJ56_9BACT|nr:glycosyltransferase family 39 protein [Edaphobacter acidisoli]GGA58388.1 glycosyl transferase [Edaphobacter acidisoli]